MFEGAKLDGRTVPSDKIVESDRGNPRCGQRFAGVRAHISSTASDENVHRDPVQGALSLSH